MAAPRRARAETIPGCSVHSANDPKASTHAPLSRSATGRCVPGNRRNCIKWSGDTPPHVSSKRSSTKRCGYKHSATDALVPRSARRARSLPARHSVRACSSRGISDRRAISVSTSADLDRDRGMLKSQRMCQSLRRSTTRGRRSGSASSQANRRSTSLDSTACTSWSNDALRSSACARTRSASAASHAVPVRTAATAAAATHQTSSIDVSVDRTDSASQGSDARNARFSASLAMDLTDVTGAALSLWPCIVGASETPWPPDQGCLRIGYNTHVGNSYAWLCQRGTHVPCAQAMSQLDRTCQRKPPRGTR